MQVNDNVSAHAQKWRNIMTKSRKKRLLQSMTGHYQHLLSVFSMTGSHKLPGAKGMLRERALAEFIKIWIPRHFSVPTNVFATTRRGEELPTELDLAIHDGSTGSVWPLDSYHANSVATWEDVKLVAQVKSTLGEKQFKDACSAMSKLDTFSEKTGTPLPLRILFAYKVKDDFVDFLLEKFIYSSMDAFPFDAFILLDHGAYISDSLRELRIGIRKGLSERQVMNDGPSQDTIILEDVVETRIPNGYRQASDGSPESTLLAFAVLATTATAGDEATQALLAACLHPEYNPIFDDGSLQ